MPPVRGQGCQPGGKRGKGEDHVGPPLPNAPPSRRKHEGGVCENAFQTSRIRRAKHGDTPDAITPARRFLPCGLPAEGKPQARRVVRHPSDDCNLMAAASQTLRQVARSPSRGHRFREKMLSEDKQSHRRAGGESRSAVGGSVAATPLWLMGSAATPSFQIQHLNTELPSVTRRFTSLLSIHNQRPVRTA